MTRQGVVDALNSPTGTTIIEWFFILMIAFMVSVLVFSIGHSIWREKLGGKCVFCRKPWVGKGCGCIARSYSKMPPATNKAFLALSLDEKLYRRMRGCQRRMLTAIGPRARLQWRNMRDAYLIALMDYRDSRKQGIFR